MVGMSRRRRPKFQLRSGVRGVDEVAARGEMRTGRGRDEAFQSWGKPTEATGVAEEAHRRWPGGRSEEGREQGKGRPSKDLSSAARVDSECGCEGFEIGAGDGSAVEVCEFLGVGNQLDFLAQPLRDSLESNFQRFKDILLLGEDQTFLMAFLATFLAELFGE